ncbi:MAG: hypothetical protein AUJ97_01895 [Bacteroidetes bacterium CG2_30_32_10]|nr:MAG: hypothetical protein AUJ97_01895 [Bacteroidetes bacterium CG2_30_32_10]
MDYFNQFRILFKTLADGEHQYIYIIDESFFENYEMSEIKKGNIKIVVSLDKKPTLMSFVFNLEGSVNVMCDRCLDYFDLPITNQFQMFVKFGEKRIEQTEEILIIPESDNELSLTQYIYEYIYLSLPIQRIHPDNEKGYSNCNPLFLEKLKEFSKSDKKKEETDPRWEILNNIKLN